MRFSEIKYTRPDLSLLRNTCISSAQIIGNTDDVKTAVDAYRTYEKELIHAHTMLEVAAVRHTIDTTDDYYSAENDFADENNPLIAEWVNQVEKALLSSPARPGLEKVFGPLFFKNLEISERAFKSELIPLMQEENKLASAYEELEASAEVEWEGKNIPLTLLGKYKQSPDREIRKRAYRLEGEYYDNHRVELDDIFDKLVHNRDKQGKLMGYPNFLQLGYDRLGRNCYGPEEVARFRQMILEDIVPIATKIKQKQAERIGVDQLYLYDDSIWFKDGNAAPIGDADAILAAGLDLYHNMSSETAEFIDFMYDGELLDVLSKKGKAPGGYCTEFTEFKSPFIFANFNGTAADVDVLTHEGGHAFAAYRAFKNGIESALSSPTIEACEVHSMSMEFLTSPYHDRFFGDKTEKYAYYHAADALTFIPYGCLVDAFQHEIYEHPDLTPEERNACWDRLERQFRPYLCRDGIPFYGRGSGWQRQLHIYLNPLYYIDYCMAQTVAFDFYAASMKDYKDALSRYFTFVDFGGTKTFSDLCHSAGFKVPYEPGAIREVAKDIDAWLDSHGDRL